MDRDVLKKLGLNDAEIRVYLALLETGQTTTGLLVKNTKVPSSKIYHVLEALIEKGMASYIVQGKVKCFRASRPIALRHLLDMREQETEQLKNELEEILPLLDQEFLAEKTEYKVELFEGLRGIKTVYDISLDALHRGDEMYTIGYPLLASQLLHAYFKDYHRKLGAKGLHAKILYDYDTWFWKKRESRPHAEQRYLPRGIKTPAFIHIFKDCVGIMVLTEKQKLCIFIKNKEIADSYLHYFNLLWRLGRKPEKGACCKLTPAAQPR